MEWRNEQPYSRQFGDVYFSSDNGLLESEYVFLQGNCLAARWQASTPTTFTVIETGFGTGLNFLNCAKLWLDNSPMDCRLHYISVEKYPLSIQDISTALELWPSLAPYKQTFLAHYPQALNNQNLRIYDGRIELSLHIGDATECLARLNRQADAWFLDGFAPAKNPAMWQAGLFQHMARLSHAGTTFATFTSAGEVRRSLIAAGFQVQKRVGFGKKREMLVGEYAGEPAIHAGSSS